MPRLPDYLALSNAVYGPRPTEPIVVTVGSGPGSTQTWDFRFDSGDPSLRGHYEPGNRDIVLFGCAWPIPTYARLTKAL